MRNNYFIFRAVPLKGINFFHFQGLSEAGFKEIFIIIKAEIFKLLEMLHYELLKSELFVLYKNLKYLLQIKSI
jgi:hypothetical protein